jgi:hypothetical protein
MYFNNNLNYNNYKQAMFLGPERWFCETETSSPVITFLCTYKRVVSDEKYCLLYLLTLSYKRQDFLKKKIIENKMLVFLFSLQIYTKNVSSREEFSGM